LDFLNKAVKNSLRMQDYKQLGRLRRFYSTMELQTIPEFQLQVWPGYSCLVKLVNDGFFLNIDTNTKFL
jgi:hypothetical protein